MEIPPLVLQTVLRSHHVSENAKKGMKRPNVKFETLDSRQEHLKSKFYEIVKVNVNEILTGRKAYLVLNALFPVILGASIYLLFRDTSLLVFQWMDSLCLFDDIMELRIDSQVLRTSLPQHVLYSLPDGCWVLAMTAVYRSIWDWNSLEGSFWISLGCILGLGGEFGQLLGFVPGHFDWWDVGYMVVGFVWSNLMCSKSDSI